MQTHLLHLYGIDFVIFHLYPCCTYCEKYYFEWCLSSGSYICGWPNVWCQTSISGTSPFSRVRWMVSSWIQDLLDTFITCQIKKLKQCLNIMAKISCKCIKFRSSPSISFLDFFFKVCYVQMSFLRIFSHFSGQPNTT